MVNLQKTTIKKVVENSDKIQEKELITSKTSKKEFAIKKQHLEEKKLAQNPPENKLIDEEEMEGDDKITYKNSGAVDYKIGSVNNPAPNYPKAAFRRGHEGNVDICAEVDSNGDPLKVNICSSSGYKSLDYAALKTIKNWKFSIKSKILHSVYYVKVPINFSISS